MFQKKQKSTAQHSRSQFSIPGNPPLIHAWLGRFPQFPVGFLFLTAALNPKPHGISLLQTAWHLLTHQTSWQMEGPFYTLSNFQTAWLLPFSLSPPLFLNTDPEFPTWPHYLASSAMCYFCQSPHIFHLLLAAIFSQGKSTPWHRSLCPPAPLAGTVFPQLYHE